MILKKFSKLGIGASALIACSIFTSTLAWASPKSVSHPTPRSTPYGTMTGDVTVDCNNGYWTAITYCTGNAPIIYVEGECQNRRTGKLISRQSSTKKNTKYVDVYGDTNSSYSVTVHSTHEIRAKKSYTRYTSVSQTL